MIASDLHGSAFFTKQLLDAFDREQADRLLLLGDILNHGPRNGLPQGYDPMAVASMLNARKEKILCIRGNCDSEVDQVVLEFSITAECVILSAGKRMVYAVHGHRKDAKDLLLLQDGDILLHGHTHVRTCEEKEGYICCNPGSVTFPKDGFRGYMILENNVFYWRTLEGVEVSKLSLER